jgi:hypothetical protein
LPTKTTYRAIPANCRKFLGSHPNPVLCILSVSTLDMICCIEILQSFHFVFNVKKNNKYLEI